MNEIQMFCRERGINSKIEESFTTYVKVSYSTSLSIRPGDTLSKMINNMSREKVEEMWTRFVMDFKDSLV